MTPAARPSARRDARGQALLEFLFASLLAIVMILGVIQIALIFNAQSMVKLAAYNAARGAIVSRGWLAPDGSANWLEMRARGKLSVFLTLLPVMPGLHGQIPLGIIALFEKLVDMSPGGAARNFRVAGFELFGKTWGGDYGSDLVPVIDVQFVDPVDESTIMGGEPPADQWLSFDDSDIELPDDPDTGVSSNVVKVQVTWQYPLVVPIANRIILALMRPRLYREAVQDPLAAENILQNRENAQEMPIWALGSSMDSLLSRPENLLFHIYDRIPIKATYVMRMQNHRAPSYIDYNQMILGEVGEQFPITGGGTDLGIQVLEQLQKLIYRGTDAAQEAIVEHLIGAPTDPDSMVP